ncbi:MAG: bifunctional glutamate N-acetyltransferase/amino-acid acetyltransferase ArgJ [Acidobacteriaceae bacterium]|nr:bifunctional glutamate N-acetyltransferase/amino-acid acetyltransferase ArgJ [Acidobacteriaceae bacterium]
MSTSSPAQLPLGFRWASVTAGIKASGKPDVALAVADEPAVAAVMFTKNQVVAAPVIVGRQHLAANGSKVRAVIVNAGNANCCTGDHGLEAAQKTCIAVANAFDCVFDEVFPSSTGIIGVPLPVEKLVAAVPAAKAALGSSQQHAEAFGTAILTTDTKLKTAEASFEHDGKTVRLWGCAKGAGMIGPQLGPPHATMLSYLFTDLAVRAEDLQAMLEPAVEDSYNAISIDGDTSTNDTVLLLASGKSGVEADEDVAKKFAAALQQVTKSLAFQIVDDGEGVTHVVRLAVTGMRSNEEARTLAKSVGNSPLCKTAWSSADPNWGRILAAAGKAGVAFDPAKVTVHIGDLPVFEYGTRSTSYDEARCHEAMSAREFTIRIDFGEGEGASDFLTCDLTHDYVSINADYST